MRRSRSANLPPSPAASVPAKPRDLERYRQMRTAGSTPEPFGGEGAPRPHLYTIQKHAARRMHYDFRLEWNGVLLSWAVPKGPSFDPNEKRLAVEVEDHPVEYADFEGVIPAGNYGAGGVIVWDRGAWAPVEDIDEGLRKGKLVFTLEGYKLHGEWTLVRTKRRGVERSKEWLLIKHRDAHAGKGRDPPDVSILSGRTVEEVATGSRRGDALGARVRKTKAPRRTLEVGGVTLMLAEVAERAFDDAAWLFELKYDGYRMLAGGGPGGARLRYRRGGDATPIFPDVAVAIGALAGDAFILDGEVTVLDDEGRPSFRRLQDRAQLTRALDIARASVELPATFYAFDLLAFGGHDLRPLPLVERKRLLRALLPPVGPIRFADHVEGDGVAFYDAVRARGLEGVMAKRADAPYVAGRVRDWLKIRAERTADFAVVGYAPSDKRALAALYLAVYEEARGVGRFVYAGRVGGGFTAAQLRALKARLDARRRPTPPIAPPPAPQPERAAHVWCEPEIVVEVRYRERTDDGVLRLPTFLRVRDDQTPRDCRREGPADPLAPAAAPEPIPASARTVPFSNRDKVFWPEDGYTKGALIDYYRAISPFMLPYLADRPLVLTRYPDGIHGKSFFQKDAPGYVPPWLRTERMWSEHAHREIDYFICDDEASLLYVVNLGTIPIHVWSSRVRTLPTPDWCILDLDPKGAPFADVVKLARAIRALTEEIELPSYVKTSGSTGLHVLLPLGRACSYDQSKTLGELVSRVIAGEHPAIATVERVIAQRGGRVYLDYLQNGHGKTIVGPYSARPLPGAPVSMPLRWSEVGAKLDPRAFTIANASARMEKRGDPMVAAIDEAPRLDLALERLAARVARAGR